MKVPKTPSMLLLALVLVLSFLGVCVESSYPQKNVCDPDSRVKYPARHDSLPSVLDMHALRFARKFIEKANGVMDFETLKSYLEYKQLQTLRQAYEEQREAHTRYRSVWETLYSCVQSVSHTVLFSARRDETRVELERCACDLMRRQLSRAVVLFFDCELESVDSGQFSSVYRDKVARINFLVRKRMVLNGGGGVEVRDQYDAIFDKCVRQPLMRVAKPLVIEYSEATRPKNKPKTREVVSSPALALKETASNRENETPGATDGAHGELKSRANDETSLSESAAKTTSHASDPGASEGSASSKLRENPTDRTEHMEVSSAPGDSTVLENKTASSPETSGESEQPESSHGGSENAARGLGSIVPVGQEITESLDGAATATSQESDLEDHGDDEVKPLRADDEPTGSVSVYRDPESKESEQLPTQTPTATATVDITSEPATSVDSSPENFSRSSLFWVLLSCVNMLALGILLVLVSDRIRRNANQWLPLVDLEPSNYQQVTPELASLNDELSISPTTRSSTSAAVAELVDATLVSPPSSLRGPDQRMP